MARTAKKHQTRLEQRRKQHDALSTKSKEGRKRPGSTNAHKS